MEFRDATRGGLREWLSETILQQGEIGKYSRGDRRLAAFYVPILRTIVLQHRHLYRQVIEIARLERRRQKADLGKREFVRRQRLGAYPALGPFIDPITGQRRNFRTLAQEWHDETRRKQDHWEALRYLRLQEHRAAAEEYRRRFWARIEAQGRLIGDRMPTADDSDSQHTP